MDIVRYDVKLDSKGNFIIEAAPGGKWIEYDVLIQKWRDWFSDREKQSQIIRKMANRMSEMDAELYALKYGKEHGDNTSITEI
jgi:hypothetical protein